MHDRPTAGNSPAKRLFLLIAILTVSAVVWSMLGEPESATAAEGPGDKVLARVNGVEITQEEIEKSVAGQLLKLQRDRHELISQAVDTRVRNTLLEAAAEKRGITQEELMEAEVNGKTAEVAAEDVDAFYEARKQQIRQPKERVEDQIRRFIRYEDFMKELRAVAEIEMLREPFRVEVDATGPKKGPDGAQVTIIEFSDFECPFCNRVNPAIQKVLETYGDKVQIVFRQYPLDIHKNARKAGEASLCADEQGKFWEMHDGMFDNQKNLGVDGLKSIAASVEGIDVPAFNKCLESGRHAETVQRDLIEGATAGVNSTPAFFINGRYLSGAQPFESFSKIIDEELASGSAG